MSKHLLRSVLANTRISKTGFHTSTTAFFWDIKKSGYEDVIDPAVSNVSENQRNIKEQLKLLYEEQCATFRQDNMVNDPEKPRIIWKFNEGQKSRDQWVVTSDSDYNEGYSTAKLEISPAGTGIFSGIIDPNPPQDGKLKYAGFGNITTIPRIKSFGRTMRLHWLEYNTLILRVRGDGRSYTLNLLCKGMYDVSWNDLYFYVMYTRGGPYWQDIEVPFSKFAFTSKGILQDKQLNVPLHDLTNFGITLADKIPAPFRLEIEYVGVKYNPSNNEETAYETYDQRDLVW